MNRTFVAVAIGALMLGGCGGPSGTGGTTVVPGTGTSPTPTPTASPAPSPTPSPTPSPSASYSTYDALTGNQSFKTACATFIFNANPPAVAPAVGYGEALTLDYVAATDTYNITGDTLNLSYGPADRDPAAPSTVKAYNKTVDGFMQRFTIGRPAPGGIGLDYVRGFGLRALKFSAQQYSCVFGVPTLLTDIPPVTSVTFTRVGLSGSAYRSEAGRVDVYSLQTSTATMTVDLTTGAVTSDIHLIGTLQTPAGAGATLDLGSFKGTGEIDLSKGSYYGQFADASGAGQFAYFGGWFFGPQGREAAYAFNLMNRDGPVDILAVGTVTAAR